MLFVGVEGRKKTLKGKEKRPHEPSFQETWTRKILLSEGISADGKPHGDDRAEILSMHVGEAWAEWRRRRRWGGSRRGGKERLKANL